MPKPNKAPAFLGLTRNIDNFMQIVSVPLRTTQVVSKQESDIGPLYRYASNRCQHRGMEVVNDDIKHPCEIKCPYHGQHFIPNQAADREGEFLFSPPDGDQDWLEPGPRAVLRWFTDQIGEQYQELQTRGAFPWYAWMINTMDVHHLRHVHPGFQRLFPAGVKPEREIFGKYYSSYTLDVDPKVVESFKKRIDGNVSEFFWHATVFPNLSLTSFLGCLFSVETVLPGMITTVQTRYFVNKKFHVPDAVVRAAMKSNIEILQEDRDILSRLGRGFDLDGSYWPGEGRIKHFIDLVKLTTKNV